MAFKQYNEAPVKTILTGAEKIHITDIDGTLKQVSIDSIGPEVETVVSDNPNKVPTSAAVKSFVESKMDDVQMPIEVDNAIEAGGLGWTESEPKEGFDITWDGDTEGLESVNSKYKVSNALDGITSMTDLIGSTVTIVNDGEEQSFEVEEEDIVDYEDGSVAIGQLIIVVFVATDIYSQGVWFNAQDDDYVSRLYKEASTEEVVHQIDQKYIPSGGQLPPEVTNAIETDGIGWTEQDEPPIITWDGDTEDKERIVIGDEVYLYRISNFDQTFYGNSEMFYDLSIPEPDYQNMSTNECSVITSIDGNAKLYVYSDTPILCIANSPTEFSIDDEMYNVPSEGIYFIAMDETYMSKLTRSTTHQVADKYLSGAIKRATAQFITREEFNEQNLVRYWDEEHKTVYVSGKYLDFYLKYDNGNYYIDNLDDLHLAITGFTTRLCYNIERSTVSPHPVTFYCAYPSFYDTTASGEIIFTNQRMEGSVLKTDYITIKRDGTVIFRTV